MEANLHLGWREWCALPELGIPAVKAKVDTGARTSALHTFGIKTFTGDGRECVRFLVHPLQKNSDVVCECTAPVKDRRMIADSGGHREERIIIETTVVLGDSRRIIEMSLTDRDTMRFRMLLGRRTMSENTTVYPNRSYLTGRLDAAELYSQKGM